MENQRNAQYGIALLRVMVGIIFVAHAGMKLFGFGVAGTAGFFASVGIPFAYANALFIIALEGIGGAMLVAGLFTRYLAPLLAATMVVAIATVHGSKGFFNPEGFEYPLLLLVANASLFLAGSGALALDNVVGRARAPRSLVAQHA